MFKFKLKNGISGIAKPNGVKFDVEFNNGVKTKVDAKIVEKNLASGVWNKKQS